MMIGDFILAGMGIPLPFDTELTEVATEPYKRQIQLLCFAGAALLVSAVLIKVAWNALIKDSTKFPQLGYLKSLGIAFLWGLAMFLVLMMIHGSRHVLTPNAWVRDGWTYRLNDETTQQLKAYRDERRKYLESVGGRLLEYVREHDGMWPETLDELGGESVTVPGAGGLGYVYSPKQDSETVLVEPEIDSVRFALMRDGKVRVQ